MIARDQTKLQTMWKLSLSVLPVLPQNYSCGAWGEQMVRAAHSNAHDQGPEFGSFPAAEKMDNDPRIKTVMRSKVTARRYSQVSIARQTSICPSASVPESVILMAFWHSGPRRHHKERYPVHLEPPCKLSNGYILSDSMPRTGSSIPGGFNSAIGQLLLGHSHT
jgi:hypothetical protein